jgi:hypothetical protein
VTSGGDVIVGASVPRPHRLRPAVPIAAAVLTLTAALAGCGGDDPKAGTPAASTAASAPTAVATVPATTTQTAAPPASTTPPSTAPQDTRTTGGASPETAPGGAGDEQPIRVPADYSLRDGQVTPGKVTVPAFLSVELSFRAADGQPHEVLVRTPTPTELSVPASGAATRTIAGLRSGLYLIVVDGKATNGALVVGGDAGP